MPDRSIFEIQTSFLEQISNYCCLAFDLPEVLQVIENLFEKPTARCLQASEASLVVDFKDWQVPLSRRFRSLKLWMVMRLYGAEGIRRFIRSHIQLAAELEGIVRADERYEVRSTRRLVIR